MEQDWRWIVSATLIFANWPYTLLIIMPANHKLRAIADDDADPTSRAVLWSWARLHAVSTALGCATTVALIWAMN